MSDASSIGKAEIEQLCFDLTSLQTTSQEVGTKKVQSRLNTETTNACKYCLKSLYWLN